ncbi:MAG: D-arabinose 5-phosphate isomerase [Bacteroidetes bacterium CG2_30_33_31]|nr:MAG: D-arabinose 5-phosphate isomerase [Bacteroidetes bacterium CG2_30_33_31]
MLNRAEIIIAGKKTIEEEIFEVQKLSERISESFADAVQLIANSNARVVVTGIGKSANIGAKIVATLNSTGTPATFMHAVDAIHGDLGIIQKNDVVIVISKSGNTPEIKVLVSLLKSLGNKIVAIVGNIDSTLAKQSDIVLDTTVEKEACPNNLAPTSSTTAQLIMGDALAVSLLKNNNFSEKDFAKFHPGGALGKKLYLRIEALAIENEKPAVDINDKIRKIILEISSKRLGATAVIENDKLVGIITDGDLRRMMERYKDVDPLTAREIMSKNPRTLDKNQLAVDAFKIMKDNNITQLLVTSEDKYFGVIHLHDILKEGIL